LEPSNNNPPALPSPLPVGGATRLGALDRATLAGMGAGMALMLQPWWPSGFRAGFFLTLIFTVAQIVVVHAGQRDSG
jgi:hypothetical protein